MIDIARALQHSFDDSDWPKKLGLGALISAVPVLSFAGNGFALEHLRNVERGQELPLPDWETLGAKFSEGLKQAVVSIIYASPIIFLMCAFTVGAGVLASAADGRGRNFEDTLAAAFGLGGLAVMCVALVYGLAVSYLAPAIAIKLAHTGSIGACFKLGDLLAIARAKSSDYLVAWITLIGVALAGSMVLSVLAIVPCLGQIAGVAGALALASYMHAVSGHLYGQYARQIQDVLPGA